MTLLDSSTDQHSFASVPSPLPAGIQATEVAAPRAGRVLHIAAGNLYGGVESCLVTLNRFRSLAPEMLPEFGVCFSGRLQNELTSSGANVYDFRPVRLSRPWTILRARRKLTEVLQHTRPDAVVMHGAWGNVVFGPIVKRRGVRLVLMLHNDARVPHLLDRLSSWCAPDLVMANSHFTAEGARRLFPRSKTEVCYLPVAAPMINSAIARKEVRRELETPPHRRVILQTSRLERGKGQLVLLQALAKIKNVDNWECWLVGGPQRESERQYFEELISASFSLGLGGRIRFLGQRGDVRRLLSAADIYCQPNTSPETFGISFIEALYAGLPVITSRFGGANEIVTDTVGILTKPADSEGVALALRRLLDEQAFRERLSRNGPGRASELCDPQRQLIEFQRILFQ